MSLTLPSTSTQAKPYGCPHCKRPIGYLQADVLHVEINGHTYTLDGFINFTCPAPCNTQWKYRSATTRKPLTPALTQQIA